jgi:O-antigen/teichoic acid export membrane protein
VNLITNEIPKIKVNFSTNLIFFFLSAVFGLAVNILIIKNYSVNALGVFNQIYVFIIIFSQFSAFGFHHYIFYAINNQNKDNKDFSILLTCIIYSLMTGLTTFALIFLLSDSIGVFFDSYEFAEGLKIASFSLIIYGANRVSTAYLNMKRKMILHGLINLIRIMLIFVFITILIINDLNIIYSGYSFIFAEFWVFCFLIIYIFIYNNYKKFKFFWDKKIFQYSLKSVFSNIFLTINLKIDILIVAYLLSDYSVGIYSFALIFYEGCFSLLTILRSNLNPTIKEMLLMNNKKRLTNFKIEIQKKIFIYFFIFIAAIVLLFKPTIYVFNIDINFLESWIILIILLLSLLICSINIPFNQILLFINKPHLNSFIQFSVISVNIIGNTIMINLYGLIGAAIATGLSIIIGNILFLIFCNKNDLKWINSFRNI